MSSKLLINVNDASIVVPDTSGDSSATTPDTGGNTILAGTNYANDNGTSMVLPILGISLLVLLIITAIITTTVRRHKTNKAGKFSINNTKRLIARVTTLSAVVLLAILATVNLNSKQEQVEAITNTDELTITTSDIEIDVDLDDEKVFAMGESVVSVDSATPYGYTLMVYVDSDSTDLTNETNTSSKSTIDMIDSLEPAALADNTWGFATTRPTDQTSAVFTGIPNTLKEAATLKYTEEPTTANDESTFYYGTYVTPDLDYGTYSGVTITYVAIANICNPLATSIGEAVCLQDFAGPNRDQIVDSMTPERQYTLIDKRDKKTYTLAKFPALSNKRDQVPYYQVWMTQNLDLDIDSNTTYTNKDTDLGYNTQTKQYETASWMPERSTYTTGTATWGLYDSFTGFPNGMYHPESYDPGDNYWNGRAYGRNNNGSLEWEGYFGTCDWDSNNQPYNCDESINPYSDYVSSTGIPQYHLGNYYNWTAAVAMNDSSDYVDYGDLLEQSICPAGWTLPRAGFIFVNGQFSEDAFNEDSFASLWEYYGFEGSWFSTVWEGNGATRSVWEGPLYFAPAGGWAGFLGFVGEGGDFWSSIAESDLEALVGQVVTEVYHGSFNRGGNRSGGSSIRCIARPVSDTWIGGDNL